MAAILALLQQKACCLVAEPENTLPQVFSNHVRPKEFVPLPSIPGTVLKKDKGAWFQLL